MKYLGGKARIAKEIVPLMLRDRKEGQTFVEPFCGGCNITSAVDGPRIASDVNPYLIAFWDRVVNTDWKLPHVSKAEWARMKARMHEYDPALLGWVGFGCSYMGIFFGGYSGTTKTKAGTLIDFQAINIRVVNKQRARMQGTIFRCEEYYKTDIAIPEESIIYADPPYAGTAGYKVSTFNTRAFWSWIRRLALRGHRVFVSEYEAPDDFVCIWEKPIFMRAMPAALVSNAATKVTLATRIERLFVPKHQREGF